MESRQVAPGIWKITLGTPEAVTPVAATRPSFFTAMP